MIIDDKGIDEKLHYDINREAGKISALPSGKIDKYGYLTGKKIFPSNQIQIIEQVKCPQTPLGNVSAKNIETS